MMVETETPEEQVAPVAIRLANIEDDLIRKADAGAGLVYALYHLPLVRVKALLNDATPGFSKAWVEAQAAYGVGGRH